MVEKALDLSVAKKGLLSLLLLLVACSTSPNVTTVSGPRAVFTWKSRGFDLIAVRIPNHTPMYCLIHEGSYGTTALTCDWSNAWGTP